MFKANIKEIKKEIEKMGKQEYLKQRRAIRKGATTAYNESYNHIKEVMSQMSKFASTDKNPSFRSRVTKKLRERPGNIGFEIEASTKNINMSEIMQGPVVPAQQKGIKTRERRPLKLKFGRKVVKDKRKRFVATTKAGSRFRGVYTRKGDRYKNSTIRSLASRLGDKKVHDKITDKIIAEMTKELEK